MESHSLTTPNLELMTTAFGALNAGELDSCEELLTEDFIINLFGMPVPLQGRDIWRHNVDGMYRAFPDLQADIDDMFGSQDRVAVRVTFHGTHQGEFQGVPATHREVRYQSLELYRIVDGKIAEEWIASDIATLMGQISADR
jgi:steroid delta-isomerase-like uncharacterized protein